MQSRIPPLDKSIGFLRQYLNELWQSELSDIESESDWQAIDDLDYLNLN